MLNTPQELSSATLESDEELNESPETEEEAKSGEETEESETEESSEEETVYQIGDKEITLSELQRLEDKSKNLESGYTKKRQSEAAEHKAKVEQVEALAETLTAQADAFEAFLTEDEDGIDWDDLTTSEAKAVEKKFKSRRNKLTSMRKSADKAAGSVSNEAIAKTNDIVISHFSEEWKGSDSVRQKALDGAMKYALSIGHTQESISKLRSPQEFIALIDGGKLMAVKNAKPQKKKAVKVPKSTGRGQGKTGTAKTTAELFYGS